MMGPRSKLTFHTRSSVPRDANKTRGYTQVAMNPLTVSRRSGSASQSKNKSDGLVMSMTFYDYDL